MNTMPRNVSVLQCKIKKNKKNRTTSTEIHFRTHISYHYKVYERANSFHIESIICRKSSTALINSILW
jgi:hypothetical protein